MAMTADAFVALADRFGVAFALRASASDMALINFLAMMDDPDLERKAKARRDALGLPSDGIDLDRRG